MTVMQGMNPEQVRELSRSLSRQAHRLDEIASALSGTMRSLQWSGPDAEQLRSMWDSSGHRSLAAAAESLRSAGQVLVAQAGEQEQASGGGDSSGVAVVGAVGAMATGAANLPPGFFDAGQAVLDRWEDAKDSAGYTALTGALGFSTALFHLKPPAGYPALYKAFSAGADDVLQGLDKTPFMKGLSRFDTAYTVVDRGAALYGAFWPGRESSLGDKIDAVGNTASAAMKANKENFTVYLAGVATASVTEAAVAATKVDWSAEGMHQVWDAVTQDPGMVADELGKATKEVFTKRIWSILV